MTAVFGRPDSPRIVPARDRRGWYLVVSGQSTLWLDERDLRWLKASVDEALPRQPSAE